MPFRYRLRSDFVPLSAAFRALPHCPAEQAFRAWRAFWCRADPRLIDEFSYVPRKSNDPPWVSVERPEPGSEWDRCWPWPWGGRTTVGGYYPAGCLGGVDHRPISVKRRPQRVAVALSLGHCLLTGLVRTRVTNAVRWGDREAAKVMPDGDRWCGGPLECDDSCCCNPWHLAAVPSVEGATKARTPPRDYLGRMVFDMSLEDFCDLTLLTPARAVELRRRKRAKMSAMALKRTDWRHDLTREGQLRREAMEDEGWDDGFLREMKAGERDRASEAKNAFDAAVAKSRMK